ncbi:acetyl-CoA C-acyltransferase [Lysinibacillus sp. 2017]|uniref:acetyl-CoA C-acyltransferase n=1 Tax=unclassified Lysinibacillus TaxID=2636778 RepID=UPI000D526F53|nr:MULTISPECIES: acetyl-CoA C-acyltransferase [unclassified Lysinibacillus]AWE06790.1 acetyl-CoA C-acyltransferase [Lysinibacillus sp. 2017]TGN37280.1 acetyl-CoA C-acyltransferase [Lysinibacillus sp. S2017]
MDAYIYDAVRTPRGSTRKNGSLHDVEPVEMVKQLFAALQQRNSHLTPAIEDVILGCVTQLKDQGANIAKTAATYAGLPYSVPGMTITRFCTSGLDAISIAASKVHSVNHDVIVAGGVESVSRVPMFSDEGAWFANPKVSEETKFIHMGISADLMAHLAKLERQQLDSYSVRSHQRAAKATTENRFHRSMIPIRIDGKVVLSHDELIREDASLDKLTSLEPSFAPFLSAQQLATIQQEFTLGKEFPHVHHVGNSPSLADGAALLVIGNESAQQSLQQKPIAKIIGTLSIAEHPMLLLGGQAAAEKLLKKCNLTIEDMDVIEFYEAYAATAVKAMQDWHVDDHKFNPNGGVIATGHALGATGAMMLCSLLDELQHRNGKFGLVTLSGGGGVGTAMIVEKL